MPNIVEVVLFVSSTSPASARCLSTISSISSKLPITVVRLDTEEARQRAMHGEHFSITSVPSLLVSTEDGNTSIFIGSEKIVGWIGMIISKSEEPQYEPPVAVIDDDDGYQPMKTTQKKSRAPTKTRQDVSNMYDEDNTIDESPKPKQKKEHITPVEVIDDEPEEVKKPRRKSKAVTKRRPTKVNRAPDVESIEIIEGDIEEREVQNVVPSKRRESTKKNGRSLQMSSLLEQAKKMEKERTATLGWKEEDLPFSL